MEEYKIENSMSNPLPIYNSPSLTPTHKMNDQDCKVVEDQKMEIERSYKRSHDKEVEEIEAPETKKKENSNP